MKLHRVQISQFRSIKYLEIRFDPTCRILVGKNESGKSNILKALSLLNDDSSIDVSDLREGLPGEPLVEKGSIRFIFSLEEEDIEYILSDLLSKTLSKNQHRPILIQGRNVLSIQDYCRSGLEALYVVKFPNGYRGPSYWEVAGSIEKNWKNQKRALPCR